MLPPFNIWKEVELTKQERKEAQQKKIEDAKLSRRKLNYASSKCGAKVLAANKEAKYRTAILNEKIDEYMLNPCRAKSWFIVELCDNIEATQIELANYELYSSPPKMFSVFWSDVYPTQTWHLLGTFEAKDQRTMQTFELNTRNMGKFIKVIVLNHYGREHFCPLSVFRILGYSMVYEYEDMEQGNEKVKSAANETDNTVRKETEKALDSGNGNLTHREIQNKDRAKKNNWISGSNLFLARICELNQKYCILSKHKTSKKTCPHQPFCRFLKRIIFSKHEMHVCNNICRRKIYEKSNDYYPQTLTEKRNIKHSKFTLRSKTVNNNNTNEGKRSNSSRFVLSNLFRGKEHLLFLYSSNKIQVLNREPIMSKPVEDKRLNKVEDNTLAEAKLKRFNVDMRTMNRKPKAHLQDEDINQNSDMSDALEHCNCKKDAKVFLETKSHQKDLDSSQLGALEQEQSTQSAALIQKESVLVKLTSRMRASEMNLNLINRYLQQLSQSYRHQMEDMQNMFNMTLKAIRLASEEANNIDEEQQFAIEHLEQQVNNLNYQTQYLSNAQKDILQRVLELHGFFLILEFIIMSTIFSIFVNKFRQHKF